MRSESSSWVITFGFLPYPYDWGFPSAAPVARITTPCSISRVFSGVAISEEKSPTWPSTFFTFDFMCTVTRGCAVTRPMICDRYASTLPPSSVRYTRRAMPPSVFSFSTRCTGKPWSAMASDAVMPAMPPPITSAAPFTGTVSSISGMSPMVRPTVMRTRSLAFSVALSGSAECTHEHWSRIFAISSRYGLRPASRSVSRKIASCVRGVHDATITRLSRCLMIFSLIWSCVSSAQV